MTIGDKRMLMSIDVLSIRTAQLRLILLGRFHPDARWEKQIGDALRSLRAQVEEIERTVQERTASRCS
jgi:hypothetical protein